MSSEEQDRMGREETVHIKINRRRRSQIWRQWFGLGSLSPHSGAGSGFRIRLGLGFRMETWSRSMGAFYRERILTPGPVHITPSKPEKRSSEIFKLNWLSNNPNYFFPFCMGPQRHNYWRHCDKRLFFRFFFFKFKKRRAKLGSKPGGGLGGAGWIHTLRRVVNSGQPLTVEQGGKREDWEDCGLYLFLRSVFPEEDDF